MKVAVLGATGLVGETMLRVLEERAWDAEVGLFASRGGRYVDFMGEPHPVFPIERARGFDLYLLAVDAETSKELAPELAKEGLVVDNSSAFRLHPDVPLVVPEINPEDIKNARMNIIANPNCSTIQMLVAIAPIVREYGAKALFVATYQSASGGGRELLESLYRQANSEEPPELFMSLIPWIGQGEGGISGEELKMIRETKKILKMDFPIYPTCVRVPVPVGHSEAITLLPERTPAQEEVLRLLGEAPGVMLRREGFVKPEEVVGSDLVWVSRVRVHDGAISLWVVADNLRRGAATNAIEIAEIALGIK